MKYAYTYVWYYNENIRSIVKIFSQCLPLNKIPEIEIDNKYKIKPVAIHKDPFTIYENNNPSKSLEGLIIVCTINDSIRNIVFKNINDTYFSASEQYYIEKKSKTVKYGVGDKHVIGRNFAKEHLNMCIYAGINITTLLQTDILTKWEYKIDMCRYAEIGDSLLVSRYILYVLAEDYNLDIIIDKNNRYICYSNEYTRNSCINTEKNMNGNSKGYIKFNCDVNNNNPYIDIYNSIKKLFVDLA